LVENGQELVKCLKTVQQKPKVVKNCYDEKLVENVEI
jgi:hypothetical protein